MLTKLDAMPLDIAQLFAGLWVQVCRRAYAAQCYCVFLFRICSVCFTTVSDVTDWSSSKFKRQNLYDAVSLFAFPQVNSVGVLVGIWATNAFSNIAFLIFVSDFWIFKIRPPLKTRALAAFKLNFSPGPPPPHDMSFDPVNRCVNAVCRCGCV